MEESKRLKEKKGKEEVTEKVQNDMCLQKLLKCFCWPTFSFCDNLLEC